MSSNFSIKNVFLYISIILEVTVEPLNNFISFNVKQAFFVSEREQFFALNKSESHNAYGMGSV